jgi:hypothetical protein
MRERLPNRRQSELGEGTPLRPVYLLRLQSLCGDDIRRLRWLLKALLRRLGLRCLSIEEEAQP